MGRQLLSADRSRTRRGRHRRAPKKLNLYQRGLSPSAEFPRSLGRAGHVLRQDDQFAQVAIAILVCRRTGSPLLTALAYALTYLPPIAEGPLLSALADLFPRRRVMIVCDVIRVGLVTAMRPSQTWRSRDCAGCSSRAVLLGHRSPQPGPRCCPTSCRVARSWSVQQWEHELPGQPDPWLHRRSGRGWRRWTRTGRWASMRCRSRCPP